ncbi:MAG: membrane protein insertase YidC [Phycisphaerales bacterium]|nr:membrane protein insertase YidC [Phycisphaerales bacterium]
MDGRGFFKALLVALLVYIAYQWIYNRFAQKPAPPLNTDIPHPTTGPATSPGGGGPTTTAPRADYSEWVFDRGPTLDSVVLGGGPQDAVELTLSPIGASVDSLRVTERNKNGALVHFKSPEDKSPYPLLSLIDDFLHGSTLRSYATRRMWVQERANEERRLDDVIWTLSPDTPSGPGARRISFVAQLRSVKLDQPVMRLTKTYELTDTPQIFRVSLRVDNLQSDPLTVTIEQDGPTGIALEGLQYDMRRIAWGRKKGADVYLESIQRPALLKLPDGRKLGAPMDTEQFLWAAVTNKYFAVVTRPLPAGGGTGPAESVLAVYGYAAAPQFSDHHPGDLQPRFITQQITLTADSPPVAPQLVLEAYAGAKDSDLVAKLGPAFADPKQLGYVGLSSLDSGGCACTFSWLTALMKWLLETIVLAVRNYGVAIICVVIIVRTLLHPLAVFQQKSMYRMQESMARIQPRLEAIKAKYPNDQQKQAQESMRVWGEEGVNPAAPLLSFIPLFVQMPILVSLWTALNYDVHLRNAAFDGWWLTDLSSPDHLIKLSDAGMHIPLLSLMIGPITHINVLPILMGVSMFLQQKYMPKPNMQRRIDAAQNAPQTERKPGQMTPEEQLRQQQMMAYMMSILFPIMFYQMPSGMNLYWMATNVFGIFESLIVRKQLEAEKKRRAEMVQQPELRKKGIVSRFFEKMANQYEELQKMADEASNAKRK